MDGVNAVQNRDVIAFTGRLALDCGDDIPPVAQAIGMTARVQNRSHEIMIDGRIQLHRVQFMWLLEVVDFSLRNHVNVDLGHLAHLFND